MMQTTGNAPRERMSMPNDLLNTLSGGFSNEAKFKLLEMRLAGQDAVSARATEKQQAVEPFHPISSTNAESAQPGAQQGTAGMSSSVSIIPNQNAQASALVPGAPAPRQQPQSDDAMQITSPQGRVSDKGKTAGAQKRKRNSSPPERKVLNNSTNLLSPGAVAENTARASNANIDQQPPSTRLPTGTTGAAAPQTAAPTSARATGVRATALKASGNAAGAAGAGSRTPARTAGNQTKLNAFYPVVDGNSRESELSGGQTAGAQHVNPFNAAGNATGTGVNASSNLQSPAKDAMPGVSGQVAAGNNGLARTGSASSPGLAQQGGTAALTGRSSLTRPVNTALPSGRSVPLQTIPETSALQNDDQQAAIKQADIDAAVRQATQQLQQQLSVKQQQLEEVQQQYKQASNASDKRISELSSELSSLTNKLTNLQSDLEKQRQSSEERENKMKAELTRVMCASARERRELTRLQLASGGVQLGSIAVHRTGLALQEVWEDGQYGISLAARQQAITTQREDVEAARKALRKKLAPPPRMNANSSNAESDRAAENGYVDGHEFVTLDEIYKTRLAALKREEDTVKQEVERLNMDRAKHIRCLKRLRDEEGSRFCCGNTVLGGRFVLLSMLGKGGFSEVFKAYDLRDLRVVAAKVHQLNPGWSEARKASYVKHAIREVDIQKALRHAHIVSLVDILEIDAHCFATVLEYCEGGDLDTLLRDHTALPEKEARSILSQVISGLAYLNQPSRRIIHYDLKPANILFDAMGAAKITDFGLSKIVEDGCTQGMELTSQGAGTYWYLPPECFEVGGPTAPRITNKVDVWSVGVIFYQMLYGKRPFGEGLSQEQIMRERVVLSAREVDFPTKPTVSAEAKEFMRKCLTPKADERWDVAAAAADTYITRK